MGERAKVLAVIPARGNSKGIPRKNVLALHGMPLIGYSIGVALQSKLIDRVIVSTDCEEVARIARELGAEVPFLRPRSLAGDRSVVGEAVYYTLDRLREESYFPNAVVELYPTHPVRTVELVDGLVAKLLEGYSPVDTVRRIILPGASLALRGEDGLLRPLAGAGNAAEGQAQYYRKYGLFAGRLRCSPERPYVKVVDDPISLIDIDTMADFRLAEYALGQGLFDFHHGGKVACM